MVHKLKFKLPDEVVKIISALNEDGFEAYAVGGCVRDLVMGREPKDWDIATNALPEQIQKIFPESVYENEFGTVGIKTGSDKQELAIVEVTTYRKESGYADSRHPQNVEFIPSLKDDLSRRDFTINAMAYGSEGIVDPFGGLEDIGNRQIQSVNLPENRFAEDALRLIRAIRFQAQLSFKISAKTLSAIGKLADKISAISPERIRDEFTKIILSENAESAVVALHETGLLKYVIVELEMGVGVNQNKHHVFTIFEHAVHSLGAAVKNNYSLDVRLAALLHDIAKTQTKRGTGADATFYNHDIVGAKIAKRILERLNFSRAVIDHVTLLIRQHMFYYNVDEVSEAGIRRLLKKVGGVANFQDLLYLRIADRLGSGVPKAVPYKLRHLQYLVDKVSQDPISVGMLKINGNDIMKILGIEPGPKIGLVLGALLAEVLEDPKLNTKEYLSKQAVKLAKKSDKELRDMAEIIEEKKEEVDLETKKRHYVK